MKIGIDARLWNESGVGRYVRNLVVNLAKIDKKNSYVIFIQSKDKEAVEKVVNKEWKVVSFNSRWHSLSEQVYFPRLLGRNSLDLVHFPYFSIPIFYRSAYVVTIHDLIPHHFATGNASTLPIWLYGFKMLAYRFVVNSAVRNAKKVIAVSNFTKDDIIDNLKVNKRNLEVIYEGADDFKMEKAKKPEPSGKYFLYVGNVYPHKNAEKLIDAFESFNKSTPGYSLIFAGREDPFYKNLRKSHRKLEEGGILKFEFNLTDESLLSLYKNATALVRPSLMEGFSLPPLEAMQSECLVLASDIPVHREIFKDTILYFNPNDATAISRALKEAAGLTPDKKRDFVEKGKNLVKNFSWEKTARETLHAYESSLSI